MKFKIFTILISMLFLLTDKANAEYIIIESNDILSKSPYEKVLELSKEEYPRLSKDEVSLAIKEINYKIKEDISIYLSSKIVTNKYIVGTTSKNNAIVLFGNPIKNLSSIMIHYYVVHEIGHVIYFNMDESEKEEYKKLREIPKDWTNDKETSYINRPQEIFAEDFRILFGGEKASMISHRNKIEIKKPTEIEGLKEFIENL